MTPTKEQLRSKFSIMVPVGNPFNGKATQVGVAPPVDLRLYDKVCTKNCNEWPEVTYRWEDA